MGLKQILSSLDTKPETVDIHGDKIDFYPVRLRAILKAQSVIANVASAAASLFDPNADDYVKRTITKQTVNAAEDNEEESLVDVDATVIEAISPVHARERIARREAAITEGIKTLLDEENIEKLAILIEDSSRGEAALDDILESPPDVVIALLRGTLKANFSVFGGVAGKALKEVESKLGSALAADEESPE